MQYLADTDICIYISKQKPLSVLARLRRMPAGEMGMSIITYLELVLGAWKSERFDSNLAGIEKLRELVPVQPLDVAVARHYGRIRSGLEKAGTTIGAHDLLIAAHALSLEVTLVTNNVREFSRVRGLRVENWV